MSSMGIKGRRNEEFHINKNSTYAAFYFHAEKITDSQKKIIKNNK